MRAAKTPKAKQSRLDAVTEQLRSYATRGVFREFAVKRLASQRLEYRFVWLTPRAVRARFDTRSDSFTLVDLLPGVTRGSDMDRALRAFVAGRFDKQLPTHRRISRSLITKAVCIHRGRAVSIRLAFNRRRPAESARQAVQLISEIFQNFLAGPYHDYMVRHFDLRED